MINPEAIIINGSDSSNTEHVNTSINSVSTLLPSRPNEADSKNDTESVASDWQSAKAEQDMATMKKMLADMALEVERLKAQQAESERKRLADALAHNRELERVRLAQAQQAAAAQKAQAQAKAQADAQAKANAQAQANAQAAAAQQAAAKELADILDPYQLSARLQACSNRRDRNGYFAELQKYQAAVKRSGPK